MSDKKQLPEVIIDEDFNITFTGEQASQSQKKPAREAVAVGVGESIEVEGMPGGGLVKISVKVYGVTLMSRPIKRDACAALAAALLRQAGVTA